MANFTITIPDEKATAVIDAFCDKYGWTENSPLSKVQFAKQMIRDFVRDIYIGQTKINFDSKRKQLAQEAETYMEDVTIA